MQTRTAMLNRVNGLSKTESYKIYSALFTKNEEKEKIIREKDVIINDFIRKMEQRLEFKGQDSNQRSDYQSGETQEAKVRVFKPFSVPEGTTNIVIGSSINGKLADDPSIPQDTATHAYRGSTLFEKTKVVLNYRPTKMKTVVLQDGTNSLLKTNESTEDLFDDYKKLVTTVTEKLDPNYLILVEAAAIKQTTHNSTANTRITELNALTGGFEWSELVPDVTVKICPLVNTLLELDNPNAFYHDDIHECAFLKNQLLSFLLPTSNGVRTQKFSQPTINTVYPNWSGYRNYRHRSFAYKNNRYNQSYNYMRSF